ncbi:uncharacterized protein BJ171DRAFT_598638, partial [Polychytrium aggregatum]|uniref:uncharacterized protein n=1 Tax=Polychytrium aggregatum TaxID=110093 RepID=UPI0022FEC6E5
MTTAAHSATGAAATTTRSYSGAHTTKTASWTGSLLPTAAARVWSASWTTGNASRLTSSRTTTTLPRRPERETGLWRSSDGPGMGDRKQLPMPIPCYPI